MKKFTFGLAAIAISGGLSAQDSRLSAGLELGLPIGNFGDASGFGIGASLGYEIPIGDHLGLIAHAGYTSFLGKDIDSLDPITGATVTTKGDAMGSIPIQVGMKYYFSNNQEGFYVGLETGLHMFMVKVPTVDPVTFAVSTESKTHTNFSLAVPEVGYIIGANLDISLRYQMVFAKEDVPVISGISYTVESETVTNSYIGVRAAYMFGDGGHGHGHSHSHHHHH